MLLRLLRLWRGYVRFEILSPFPERFINLTVRKRIPIWDTARRNGRAYASMYNRDYRRIRPDARKAKARLRILKRRGLPVLIHRYRGRVGLAIGALMFALTVFVMSQFIWSVEITGIDRISQTEIQEDLRQEGFFVGAFKPAMDFDEISRNVMIRNKDVGWMAINVTGSYASVEIKEEQLPPAVENIYDPCNIKASCDAVIVRSEVREGKMLLTEGSGVVKDQLLVSGVIEDALGGVSFVHADAVIEAKTVHRATFECGTAQQKACFTGTIHERKTLCFLGADLPLSLVSPPSSLYAERTEREYLRLLDVNIPVGMEREYLYGFEKRTVQYDETEARAVLQDRSSLYEAFVLSDCSVYDREYRYSMNEEKCLLDVTYYCVEDIAYQSPIYLENDSADVP